jgi:hypothetical protein
MRRIRTVALCVSAFALLGANASFAQKQEQTVPGIQNTSSPGSARPGVPI